MYSILAFILTVIEAGVTIVGYVEGSELIFFNMVIYGSPFYVIQNVFGAGSMVHEKSIIYWLFLLFHLIKYFIIIQAQTREERNVFRTIALLLESGYISVSAYYLL